MSNLLPKKVHTGTTTNTQPQLTTELAIIIASTPTITFMPTTKIILKKRINPNQLLVIIMK